MVLLGKKGSNKSCSFFADRRKLGIFLVVIFSLFSLLLLMDIFLQFFPTGWFILDLQPRFIEGEQIRGNVNLIFSAGELIPIDSLVYFQLGSQEKVFQLADLITSEKSAGNFYAENSYLSGNGEGYGLIGEKRENPVIEFELKISSIDNSNSENNVETPAVDNIVDNSETTIVETPIETSIETVVDSSSDSVEAISETSSTDSSLDNSNSDSVSSKVQSDSSESESASSDSGSLITGAAISSQENIISGSVSKGTDFVYNLEDGESYELIADSVMIDGEIVDSGLLKLNKEGNKLTVSTDYEIIVQGFGKDFLVNGVLTLSVSLENLNLIAEENASLNVNVVYQDNVLASVEKDLIVIADEKNETLETLVNNFSIVQIKDIPTIRIKSGENSSIDLSRYFNNAESYGFNVDNVSSLFEESVLILIADEGFKGSRKANIIAYGNNGQEVLESNQFLILVSSGAVNIDVEQGSVRVGEAVKWTVSVSSDFAENISLDVPVSAENISVLKVEDDGNKVEVSANLVRTDENGNEVVETIGSSEKFNSLTGNVIADVKVKRRDSIFVSFFRNIFSITGRVVDNSVIQETTQTAQLNIDANATNYTIEYYTEAPKIAEGNISGGKQVVVYTDSELGYVDVLAFTDLDESLNVGQENVLSVYWVENNSYLPFDAYDLNENGKLDYIEWVVPHLSNQTFEIILITKAQHLDSERNFVEDIYDLVKAKDGNYTSIPSGDYVRVTFEKNLTLGNDMTIYARGEGSVGIFNENQNDRIGEFIISGENSYKIYPNYTNSDVYDLLFSGDVSVDYIVDPTPAKVVNLDNGYPTDSPDVSGNYVEDGLYEGRMTYGREDGAYYIWYAGGPYYATVISDVKGNFSTTRFYRSSSDPNGGYSAQGGNSTGSVTVSNSAYNGVCPGGMLGAGNSSNPCEITSWTQLNATRNNLSAHYILMNDLSASDGDYSGLGDSWMPIGGTFSGNFNGNSKTISNLTINLPETDYVGLFGYVTGNISNINLNVSSVTGKDYVGGLIGWQNQLTTVSNSSITLFGTILGYNNIGGLIGYSDGMVSNSYSNGGAISGERLMGGLVGYSWVGTISNSYSNVGTISGSGDYIGGLTGNCGGIISNSYATGSVSGVDYVGGIVGISGATINNSYATGSVSGVNYVGGIVGYFVGTINNSYAIGSVSGVDNVGGLIGFNWGGETYNSFVRISDSQTINGGSNVGLITGSSSGTITSTHPIVYDSQFGNITFLDWNVGKADGGNLLDYIYINNNSVTVDSATCSGCNKSANITLIGLRTNFVNPKIYKDGTTICNSTTSPACYNFTSLNAGNVTFNVSSWSNYTIVDGFVPGISSDSNSDDWHMFGKYVNHTSWDGISYPVVEGLNRASKGITGSASATAVANGYVYAVGGYNLYQLNASNISKQVSFYTTGGYNLHSPAVAYGFVYTGDSGGISSSRLYQLNASNVSQVIATYTKSGGYFDSYYSAPAVANGYVYVASGDKKLYQFNASNISQLINSYNTTQSLESTPAIANGYVYVASYSGKLYQFNATNISQLINSYNIGYIAASSPTVYNGYVYLTTDYAGRIFQFNASNVSQLIASYTSAGNVGYSSPAIANGYVYVGSDNNKLYQLSASNVSQLIASYTTGDGIYGGPSVANGYVYVGSDDYKLYQFNATNVSQFISSYSTGYWIESTPAIANGYVYVSSRDGTIYQLNANNLSLDSLGTASNPRLLYDCAELNISGVYRVENNISATGTCFNITANGVTLNGNGFTVVGNGVGSGIYSNGRNYTNITNFMNISGFFDGLYFESGSNNFLSNLLVSHNANSGIWLYYSSNNSLSGINSTFNNVIGLASSLNSYNLFSNVNSNNNVVGFVLSSSSSNFFSNIDSNSNSNEGVYFEASSNKNTFLNCNIYSNSIHSLSSDEFSGSSVNNSLVYNNSYGEIKFIYLNLITDLDSNIRFGAGQVIQITNNSAYVNSDSLPELNISANITLNLIGQGITNPQILKDGVVCEFPNCKRLNYSSSFILFNVSSWSNYTIQQDPNTAPNITQPIIINQSGSSGGVTEKGDNVTINVTVSDSETQVQNVWITIWQGVIGGPILLIQQMLNYFGNLWTVTFATNSSFNLGTINYTIYANDTGEMIANLSGNFTLVPGPGDIFNCGEINSSGVYNLQNNLSGIVGTCFTITADNVVLNGNGFNIIGNNNDCATDYGVYIFNRTNVSIINFAGISQFGDYDFCQGSYTGSWDGAGIKYYGVNNSLFANNTLSRNMGGISANGPFDDPALINQNNNFTNLNLFDNTGVGIQFYMGYNGTVSNITSISSIGDSYGLGMMNTHGIIFSNLYFLNNGPAVYSGSGSYIDTSSNNTFYNYTAINFGNAIYLDSSFDNNFSEIFSINNSQGLYLYDATINNKFNNFYSYYTTNQEVYSDNWALSIRNKLEYNNSYGKIAFISVSADMTSDLLFGEGQPMQIANNSAYVNSTAIPELNISANVTLLGLPTNMVTPKIMKDGVQCTDCYNFTSLNAGNVTFNVTSWSNYTIQDIFDPSNITSCMVLNRANTVYTLQNDINATATCFTINANNTVLDGNGHSITDINRSTLSYGVYVSGSNTPSGGWYNVTVKNFRDIVDFSNGIYFNGGFTYQGVHNSNIYNNTLSRNRARGIYIVGYAAEYITIDSNVISNTVLESIRSDSTYGIIRNNLFTNASFNRSFYTLMVQNFFELVENNTFANISCLSSSPNGRIISIVNSGNIFRNNIFINNTCPIFGSNTGTTNNTVIYDNSFGEIKWVYDNLTFVNNGSISFPGNIQIANGSAYVNTSAIGGLNTSANVTLNLNGLGINTPRIMKDGVACSAPNCNVSSYSDNVIVFNVSSWSNYTVQDASNLTSCAVLDAPGIYTLQNNISSVNTTCFTITADNVTLDGNGFSIFGDGVGSLDYGIYATGKNNLTMKNFRNISYFAQGIRLESVNFAEIYNINFSVASSAPLGFSFSNNLQVKNNTLFGYQNDAGLGIALFDCNNSIIENNNIYNISNISGFGAIWVPGGINNTVLSNTIYAHGQGISIDGNASFYLNNTIICVNSSCRGIFVAPYSNNNLIMQNNITGLWGLGSGITLLGAINNTVQFNTLNLLGYSLGVQQNSNYNTISNNLISSSGYFGIGVGQDTIENNFVNNTITLTNNTVTPLDLDISYGIVLWSNASDNYFENNLITSGSRYGLVIASGNSINNIFINNQIYNNSYQNLRHDIGGVNYLVYNNSYGQITWNSNNFTNTGDLTFPGNIQISNGSAYVNTSAISGLNISANVTLNLSGLGINLPRIMKDGVACSAPNCNVLSYSDNVIVFNVSSWSNYTIQDASNLTSCAVLDTPGVYTLQNNVSATGTCFNITSDNVTLDLNGKTIFGDAVGVDYGILSNGEENIHIINGSIANFNNMTIIGLIAYQSAGIYLNNSNSNLLTNLNINNCSQAFVLRGNFSLVSNVSLTNNNYSAVLDKAYYNSLYDLNISNSLSRALYIAGVGGGSSNNFYNILTDSTASYVVRLIAGSINNSLIYNNSYGTIKFPLTSNINSELSFGAGQQIQISNGSTYINISAIPELNISANVTLNLTGLGINTPRIMKDGNACSAPNCNVLSYSDNVVVFNVSSWSNYTVQDASNLTSCAVLDAPGVYTLQNNISSVNTTCFTITADNVTLDGNGYTANGTHNLYSSGIARENFVNASNVNNITIKNFKVTNYALPIYLLKVNNSLIQNNTLDRNIDGYALGIYCENLTNSRVDNNIIKNSVIYAPADAIWGGAVISVRFDSANNIFSNIQIINNSVYLGDYVSGGILGIQGNTQNNTFYNFTIVNNSVNVSRIHSGGGGVIEFSVTYNNRLDGFYIANNNISVRSSIIGGGIIGMRDRVSNASISNFEISSNNIYLNSTYVTGLNPSAGMVLGMDETISNVIYSNVTIINNLVSARYGSIGMIVLTSWGTKPNNITFLNVNVEQGEANYTYLDYSGVSTDNYILFNNSNGKLEFIGNSKNLTTTGNLTFPGNIQISNDSAYVNTSAISGFNTSANITFYGLPTKVSEMYNASVLFNEGNGKMSCANCNLLNSSDSDSSVTFNVSDFGNSRNYSVGGVDVVALNSGWNSVSFIMDGLTNSSKNISVSAGWNLIGLSGESNVNVDDLNFTNNGGTKYKWSQAVTSMKVQDSVVNYDSSSKKFKIARDDAGNNMSKGKGYWVYAREAGNLTLPNVRSSGAGKSYKLSELMFSNGTAEMNLTDAVANGWVANLIYDWDPSAPSNYKYRDLIFDEIESLDSLKGYFIKGLRNNINIARRGN